MQKKPTSSQTTTNTPQQKPVTTTASKPSVPVKQNIPSKTSIAPIQQTKQSGVPVKSTTTKTNSTSQQVNQEKLQQEKKESEKLKLEQEKAQKELAEQQAKELAEQQAKEIAEQKAKEIAQQKAKEAEEKAEKERIAKEIQESNGICNIRYNNYNDEFEITNGKIDASIIDKAYLFKKVFVGNYKLVVKLDNVIQPEEYDQNGNQYIIKLKKGLKYIVEVIEDYEAEEKRERIGYVNPNEGKKEEARKEGCSCIFGNPCVDEYICLDWNNRFEVAAKNGQRK